MQTDDWRGEHLIRAPKRKEVTESVAPGSSQHASIALLGRQRDAAVIRPLAKNHTRAEIKRITGLSMNRVYFICLMFKIAPMEQKFSPKKKAKP